MVNTQRESTVFATVCADEGRGVPDQPCDAHAAGRRLGEPHRPGHHMAHHVWLAMVCRDRERLTALAEVPLRRIVSGGYDLRLALGERPSDPLAPGPVLVEKLSTTGSTHSSPDK
ncbi:hypothetical protein [Streptomyces sp. NPDC054849]